MGKKKIHIEFMRILAIVFVMFNHTEGFLYFTNCQGVKGFLYACVSIFCKFAVPLFYMLSGALLLGKEENYFKIIKRAVKYIIILFAVSFLYFILYNRYELGKISLVDFFIKLYTTTICDHLWYLYSYIAIILMLPLLRKLVKSMESKDYLYLAIMHFMFYGVVPIVDYLIFSGNNQINSYFKPALFTSNNLVFFIMGYFFENQIDPKLYKNKYIVRGGVF